MFLTHHSEPHYIFTSTTNSSKWESKDLSLCHKLSWLASSSPVTRWPWQWPLFHHLVVNDLHRAVLCSAEFSGGGICSSFSRCSRTPARSSTPVVGRSRRWWTWSNHCFVSHQQKSRQDRAKSSLGSHMHKQTNTIHISQQLLLPSRTTQPFALLLIGLSLI